MAASGDLFVVDSFIFVSTPNSASRLLNIHEKLPPRFANLHIVYFRSTGDSNI